MKIIEDTPTHFTIFCRRNLFADATLLFCAGLGAFFTYGIGSGDVSSLTPIFLILGLLFAGVGVWGLWYNGSALATFDADRRMGQLRWRTAFGGKTREFHFDDLLKVSVHEDDDMHTLQFDLAGTNPVLFERAFTTNRNAAHVAKDLRDWLGTHGHTFHTT